MNYFHNYKNGISPEENIFSKIAYQKVSQMKLQILQTIDFSINNFLLIPIHNQEKPEIVEQSLHILTNKKLIDSHTSIICFVNGEKNNDIYGLQDTLNHYQHQSKKLLWFEHNWSMLESAYFCMGAVRRILVDFVIGVCEFLDKKPENILIFQADADTQFISESYIRYTRQVFEKILYHINGWNVMFKTNHHYVADEKYTTLSAGIIIEEILRNVKAYYYINLKGKYIILSKKPEHQRKWYTPSDVNVAYPLKSYIESGGFPITNIAILETVSLFERMKPVVIDVPVSIGTHPRRLYSMLCQNLSIENYDPWKNWQVFGEQDRDFEKFLSYQNTNYDPIESRYNSNIFKYRKRKHCKKLSWFYSYALPLLGSKYPEFISACKQDCFKSKIQIEIPYKYRH